MMQSAQRINKKILGTESKTNLKTTASSSLQYLGRVESPANTAMALFFVFFPLYFYCL